MLNLASSKIVLETAFVSESEWPKCQSAVWKCVSYLVCEWSAYYKVWISGAGLLSALLPNCQPIKHLHFKYISCLGQAAAPDQNYHLHFFTAEVTGSRAERMQVQCNIVRTLHSANITSSSCRLLVPGVGVDTVQSHVAITTTTLQNAAFSQY